MRGLTIVLLGAAALYCLALSGCAAGAHDLKLNNPSTLGDCVGAAPGVAAGIQEGIASRGSFASILGLIGAFAPCAKAIALDLLQRPEVPQEVKGRAELTLTLSHQVIMRRVAGQLQPLDVPAGERMQNPSGETMIRGFGR